MSKINIKLLASRAGTKQSLSAGTKIGFELDEACRLIDHGQAEPADKDAETAYLKYLEDLETETETETEKK